MPEWITNRFMAPVYALLISFGTALVLGAAMSPADTATQLKTPDAATALTIHLIPQEIADQGMVDQGPTDELQGSKVTVKRADVNATIEVGENGRATLTPPPGPLTVCVSLPKGWTGRGAAPGTASNSPCWDVVPKNGVVELLVVKEG